MIKFSKRNYACLTNVFQINFLSDIICFPSDLFYLSNLAHSPICLMLPIWVSKCLWTILGFSSSLNSNTNTFFKFPLILSCSCLYCPHFLISSFFRSLHYIALDHCSNLTNLKSTFLCCKNMTYSLQMIKLSVLY